MNMLKVGDKAPEFSVLDEQSNLHTSESLKGSRYIVFFYPRANTPGCTAEACSLRDGYALLQERGYQIFGVSEDSPKKQLAFKEKYAFQYPLLADTEHQLIKGFGVWGPKKFMGKEYDGLHRTTFLVDEEGIITHVVEKVNTKDHANQLLELIG